MAKIEKRTKAAQFVKWRGWGYEIWVENVDDYCGKVLVLTKGKKGSLHFHVNKLETMFLETGSVRLRLIDPDNAAEYFVELEPGDAIQIPRGQVHQIIADDDSRLFEFSTKHEEEDSRRVQKGD